MNNEDLRLDSAQEAAITNCNWLYRSNSDRSSALADCNKTRSDRSSALADCNKTRQLLEGSIVCAKRAVSSDSRPPALTHSRWVWRLAASYHLCYPTPRLMTQAAKSFASCGRWQEEQWAARKACEEKNHDQLALRDIEALGYDAEAVVKALFPPAAASLVDYFSRSVQVSDPIGCIGYSFAMERLALGIGVDYIQKVEAQLPPGIYATRCLRVHSCVGSDVEHVQETIDLIAGLVLEEQNHVAAACYKTALLCFSPPRRNYISEEELQQVLRPLKRRKNRLKP